MQHNSLILSTVDSMTGKVTGSCCVCTHAVLLSSLYRRPSQPLLLSSFPFSSPAAFFCVSSFSLALLFRYSFSCCQTCLLTSSSPCKARILSDRLISVPSRHWGQRHTAGTWTLDSSCCWRQFSGRLSLLFYQSASSVINYLIHENLKFQSGSFKVTV